MNILVSTAYFSEWMGGVNYLTNLYKAVMIYDPSVKFYSYGKSNPKLNDLIRFEGEISSNSRYLFSFSWFINEVLNKRLHLPLRNKPDYIKEIDGMDVCYQVGDPLVSRYFLSIEWIPDFQHIHYPDFFLMRRR